MSVSSTLQINDRMTPALQSITTAMNMMVSSFSAAQTASETAVNSAQWNAATQAVQAASAAVEEYQQELESVQNRPVSVPEPSWSSVVTAQTPSVSGTEQFQQEYQAATVAAQQLYQTQQAISAQARNMTVTPPGMLNDVAAVENRMQALSLRVQEINSIPIDMRTDKVNQELVTLNGQLSQATSIQGDLSDAMSHMDISAANAAYRQLVSVMDTAEVNIKDNIVAQEQFNRSITEGKSAATALGSKIKQFVGMYLGVQGIKMAVNFVGDTTSLQNIQTEAETKLGAVMRQRMGATPEMIQSIKDLTSAQQQLGVVGDEVQLSGAQQLSTFLTTDTALSTLIPAMNNLAVQQNGVNVSSQDMVNIGNMMGKVMQGQVGALTRVGVTFDAAQEKALKYGNEQERAATLAEVITNNVSEMNSIMAATPQGQIQQMANTWGDIKEVVGGKLYPAVMSFFTAVNTNMPRAESVIMGVAGGLNLLITGFGYIIDFAGNAAGVIQDNWSWIAPIIGGVTAAVIAYNVATGIGTIITGASAVAEGIKGAALALSTGTTFAATAGQYGLNAALLACPITWIVGAILLFVAAIYIVIGAINKFKGTSISATGVVAAIFGTLAAHIVNTFIVPTWNGIAAFINFFYNVWNDPVASVKILFYDLASTVIGYIVNMAHAIEDVINKIPGVQVSITAGLDNFQNQIKSAAQEAKDASGWKEIVGSMSYIDYSDNASKWYDKGAAGEAALKDIMSGGAGFNIESESAAQTALNTGSTAGNTAKIADAMDVMDEELKYMRDAAEQEIINRFTLAELKVDVTNHNTLKTETDFDDVNRRLGEDTAEALAAFAEGVHT